jgi:spore maturation protein CgeB
MKIIVVGPQFPDSFAYSIAANLAAMGHIVEAVDGIPAAHHRSRAANWIRVNLSRGAPYFENKRFRSVVDLARELQPDLILVTFAGVPPQTIQELKDISGALVVCWYVDSIVNLDRQYLLASPYDAVFAKEPFLVRALEEKLEVRAHYLPECCNPLAYERAVLTDEDRAKFGCDLVAMGTLHYYRARMLELFEGYDLKIWGRNAPPWLLSSAKSKYMNSYVTESEKAKAMCAAKIALTTIHCSEIEGVNGALFQTAGCGAFQIADWKPALCELFEPETEIVTFHTREELKEKVDYYLAHPQERQEIADRAYVRARNEHTYQHRLTKMLELLGLSSHEFCSAERGELMSAL